MRFLVVIFAALLIAACARAPQPTPGPGPAPVSRPSGVLIGMTATDLIARFGQPGFELREGPGTKLQWSDRGCVLDAFLYPQEDGRGVARVMHAEARAPSGAGMAVQTCIELLAR